jgi:rfaE bifunctional protein nucleotidyltransferase chain/domain
MNTKGKVVTTKELETIILKVRKEGKKIVTTNGAFDILHVGHKIALEESKTLGDILIVGINSDSSIRKYKTDLRPILPESERAELVAAFACVDYVTIFEEPDPIHLMELIKPDVYTKGGDYDHEKILEVGWVRDNAREVIIIPYVDGKSTTKIIENILKIYGKENS